MSQSIGYNDIVLFWFHEIQPRQHWIKDARFDAMVKARFEGVYQAARAGECAHWRGALLGRLAEIIVLDQFPRNMYRDTAHAFATDGPALILAQEAVARGLEGLTSQQQAFALMPFMHSESKDIQKQSVMLFERYGLTDNIDFAHRHKAIIDRFGRYPHRNALLGRQNTPAETKFLEEPGSRF